MIQCVFLLTLSQIKKHFIQMEYFLKDAEENFVSAAIVRPRKHEVRLSVPTNLRLSIKK